MFRSPVMVGRDRPPDQLRQIVSTVERGELALVVIEDEPDTGKTRLAVELVAELDSALVVTGHGLRLWPGELAFRVASELFAVWPGLAADPGEVCVGR